MSTSELGTVSTQTSSTTSQTNIDISERPAPSLGNAAAFTVLLGSLAACLGSGYWLFLAIKQQVHAQGTSTAATVSIVAASLLIALFVALPASTLTLVNPGHTKVVQFFGRYIGSLRRTGLSLLPPFANRRVVSARVQNFETHELKVNDLDGNPINIAAIVVWQVRDTARAAFAVEDYIDFVETQAESALRHVASSHPYDQAGAGETSLRGSTDMVATELAQEVSNRVTIAGIEIIEVRISALAYAPEIAGAMLQRQQASAIIAAREKIVEGAVTMVDMALNRLESEDIVALDDERKAQMVSNLLVVLCSESRATPVVNTGSLYA